MRLQFSLNNNEGLITPAYTQPRNDSSPPSEKHSPVLMLGNLPGPEIPNFLITCKSSNYIIML